MKIKLNVFQNRDLNIVLTSQLLSQISLWVGLIGNLQFLQQNVDSSFMQAIFLVSSSVASVFISPYAGKIIDQFHATSVFKWVGLLRIISVCAMLIALLVNSVWWLLVYGILVGISASFFEPSVQTVIPRVTSKDKLVTVNAINLNIVTSARIFGTMLGGILVTISNLYYLYLMAFLAYTLVFSLTFFFTKDTKLNVGKIERKNRAKVSFKAMLPLLKGPSLAKNIIILSFIPLIFISGFNLFVLQISESQGNDGIKGVIYALEGITVVLTSLFIKRFTKNKKPLVTLVIVALFIGIAQLSLFFGQIPVISIMAFCLFGFSYAIFSPLSNTLLQSNIPSEFHGRFFSFKLMIDRTIIQVSMLFIGFFLDLIGFNFLISALGVISLLLVLGLYIPIRERKKVDSCEKHTLHN